MVVPGDDARGLLQSMRISEISDAFPDSPILKPRSDKRSYRRILLGNDLQILLVSDPETDKAAGSMDVHVGSFSDPEELPGLAHFLEHMLFFSSEKYPEEDSFFKFLVEHGGSSNAYTTPEHTNFHFEVGADYLEEALDRFAQFFICPLFAADATSREIKAVDSENSKNLTTDVWRMNQLARHLSSKDHPFHKFGTGNLETLEIKPKAEGIDTRAELLKFYEALYSSNLMCFAVYGRESLDVLQKLAEGKLMQVKNSMKEVQRFSGQPCSAEHLQILVKAVPVKDGHSLTMMWPVKPELHNYREAPSHYIGHLIGHEADGSLFALLKQLGWASSLSAGEMESNRDSAFFSVDIELTDVGQEHMEEVVGFTFQYLSILRKEGVAKWIFEELKSVCDMKFHFQDKMAPVSYVSSLSNYMQLYPPEDWLAASMLPRNFNGGTLSEAIQQLTPERVRIFWHSKQFQEVATDVEPWYGTKYTCKKIDQTLIKGLLILLLEVNSSTSSQAPYGKAESPGQRFFLAKSDVTSGSLMVASAWLGTSMREEQERISMTSAGAPVETTSGLKSVIRVAESLIELKESIRTISGSSFLVGAMGQTSSKPGDATALQQTPEFYLGTLVDPTVYPLGDPFWDGLLTVPLEYTWGQERVEAACQCLARNDRVTGHLAKLLVHMVWTIQEVPTSSGVPVKALNAARFSRIFLKYFIEMFNADVVDHLLLSELHEPASEAEAPDQNVIELVIRTLLEFVGTADVNVRTYALHLEVVNLLLVMMSTQLHTGYNGAPKILHPFLEPALTQGIDLVGPFVRKLLVSFITKLPVPSGSAMYVADGHGGILERMSSVAASVLSNSYGNFLKSKGEISKSPLADNSLLLLLVLVHNIKVTRGEENSEKVNGVAGPIDELLPSSNISGVNPFRDSLEALRDTSFYPAALSSEKVDPDDLEVVDSPISSALRIPYAALFERLSATVADERSTLLLYSLVHGNATFLEYMLVRVDLDTLLVPALEVLYNASRCNPNQIYMLLIILLILSQDASFNASIHKLILPGVPWYKERLVPRTSLGSLMVVILIRIVKENLSKLRDVYLHTNCLATLANMAPHCHQLNTYASQCLVSLFDMLGRKYTRLSETHCHGTTVSISEGDNISAEILEEVPTELHIYADFLRIVLEVINSILTYALPRNPEVVYALLHRQELFQPYREHPSFQELVANIDTVIEFFSAPLKSIDGHCSVEKILEVIVSHMKLWRGDALHAFPQLRFTYEEEVHSEDFFTPYVWQLVVSHSGISWGVDLVDLQRSSSGTYVNGPTNGVEQLPDSIDPSTPSSLQRNQSFPATTPVTWRSA
ncbi:hypothetical protein R1sor_020989 [Riccia sorocarpa]|uniref:Dymeclin n=1 Tax=Riccia sorocarpa TaxID=122646 RepID=A0ABD3GFT3_9MARC